jgi:hypothetical protein
VEPELGSRNTELRLRERGDLAERGARRNVDELVDQDVAELLTAGGREPAGIARQVPAAPQQELGERDRGDEDGDEEQQQPKDSRRS